MFFHREPFLPSVIFNGKTKSADNVGKALALQIFDKAKKSWHDTRSSLFCPAVNEKEKGFITFPQDGVKIRVRFVKEKKWNEMKDIDNDSDTKKSF